MSNDTSGRDSKESPKLPGNHGQFGVDNASEAHKTLQDAPAPLPHPAQPSDGAGEAEPRP